MYKQFENVIHRAMVAHVFFSLSINSCNIKLDEISYKLKFPIIFINNFFASFSQVS